MLKNKFVSSTLILLIGGFITKILGMIIRIVTTRFIGVYGISLHNLIMPTFSLIVSICIFALPTSISKLVSSSKYQSKKIGKSALYIVLLINLFLITLITLFSGFISDNLLHEPLTKPLLICSLITIPFISISFIVKGYFYGKQNMVPTTISNIFEQVIRLVIILIFLPKIVSFNTYYGIIFIILLNIVSECLSIFIMYLFLPEKIYLTNIDYDRECTKDILRISVPSVSSKIIGNISYFFEPIIITTLLLYLGVNKDFIVLEYGLFNSFAISLLLIPSFFINAISQALLPEIGKNLNKNKALVKRRIKQTVFISLFLGIFFCTIIYIYRDELLMLLYKNSSASNYIKFIAPFFFLYYLEAPLSTALIALGGNKATFLITTIGVIVKNIVLIFFIFMGKQIYSLAIAEIVNVILVVLLDFIFIRKYLWQNKRAL